MKTETENENNNLLIGLFPPAVIYVLTHAFISVSKLMF